VAVTAIYLFICWFSYLFIYLFTYLFIYLFIFLTQPGQPHKQDTHSSFCVFLCSSSSSSSSSSSYYYYYYYYYFYYFFFKLKIIANFIEHFSYKLESYMYLVKNSEILLFLKFSVIIIVIIISK